MQRIGPLFLLVGLILAGVLLMPTSAQASIGSHVWLDTAFKGYDSFYGTNVEAYDNGSTATLKVQIKNDTQGFIIVQGAKLRFDWTGGEYTTPDSPITVAKGSTGYITFSFTVPATSVASNLSTHSYRIEAEIVREGGVYTTWDDDGSDFVIYSSDQGEAMSLRQQMEAIGVPVLNTVNSRGLLAQSQVEKQLADQEYVAGGFEGAKNHYQQALTFQQDALSQDKDPNTFSLVGPVGSLLTGIGVVLLAIGLTVYVFRRPRA